MATPEGPRDLGTGRDPAIDGDGAKEPGDFDGGALVCVSDACGLDTGGCFVCGDGVRNGFEQCDETGWCGQDDLVRQRIFNQVRVLT